MKYTCLLLTGTVLVLGFGVISAGALFILITLLTIASPFIVIYAMYSYARYSLRSKNVRGFWRYLNEYHD